MYKIIKAGKRFNSKTFLTYEEARCYVRRWIRKNMGASGNPPIQNYEFSVQPI